VRVETRIHADRTGVHNSRAKEREGGVEPSRYIHDISRA